HGSTAIPRRPAGGVPVSADLHAMHAGGRPGDGVGRGGREVLLTARAQKVAPGGIPAHLPHGPLLAGELHLLDQRAPQRGRPAGPGGDPPATTFSVGPTHRLTARSGTALPAGRARPAVGR